MKRPVFFSSFFSSQLRGSKPFTSPAIRQSKAVASKCVMGPMPLLPASRLLQTSSVPIPHPQTSPTPVTTTRRFKGTPDRIVKPVNELLRLCVLVDVIDCIFYGGDFFGVFIGDFDPEVFFESHHQLDGVERVRAQIIHK